MCYRKVKRLAIFLSSICVLSSSISYATPSASTYGTETEEKVRTGFTLSKADTDDPNGLGQRSSEPTLKDYINKLTPYLEDLLNISYEKAKKEVEEKIKEKGWDYEYTMQSFSDQGNPFDDVDYNALISAYATIVESGRNGNVLISDAPLITPEYTEVKDGDVTYAEIKLSTLDIDGLFRFYGYDPDNEELKQRYEKRKKEIEDALNETELKEKMFLKTKENILYILETTGADAAVKQYKIPDDIDESRKYVIAAALSLVGKVPYDWGGKPAKPGYDTSWWTFDSVRGRQKGLDCSGFVQWAYMTAGFGNDVTSHLTSTYQMRTDLQEISYDDLIPGDIGLMKEDDNGTNHCGIYLGNGLWAHCSSAVGSATVSTYGFRFFKRIPDGTFSPDTAETYFRNDTENLTGPGVETLSGDDGIPYSSGDVYMLAQLIDHEVGGEGFNSWVAVAEVVLNRVHNDTFPNTLHDVIYQPHQFSYVSDIQYITPTDAEMYVAEEVLKGTLKYFNNQNVLFFKNPTITDGIPASEPVNWGNLPWHGNIGPVAFYTGA